MTTTQFALRSSLDVLLFGLHRPFTWTRTVAETFGIIASSLAVAMFFPSGAEKTFAITGKALSYRLYIIVSCMRLLCYYMAYYRYKQQKCFGIIASSLAVDMFFPSGAEKKFAITGTFFIVYILSFAVCFWCIVV